jgi:hypothetical protein
MYRGEMLNGVITGKGSYQSALGEIFKGTFENGVLTGDNGIHHNYAGETFTGRWYHGEMNYFGMYRNEKGDSYDGYWFASKKHGKGYERIKGKSYYKGYYTNGFKSGRGELDFGKRPKAAKKKMSPHETKEDALNEVAEAHQGFFNDNVDNLKNRYQGYFYGGNITNGGIMMDIEVQVPYSVSRRDKERNKGLDAFKAMLERKTKGMKRINEKSADIEKFIRCEMLVKKNRIFRQQKHYMKKMMYQEDTYGKIDERLLHIREKFRAYRIQNLTEEHLISENAKVPRLQLKTEQNIVANHLKAVFDKIVPPTDEDVPGVSNLPEELKPKRGFVDNMLARIAISDFEVAAERQNMTKYDRIWERAESNFVNSKKRTNALANAARVGT